MSESYLALEDITPPGDWVKQASCAGLTDLPWFRKIHKKSTWHVPQECLSVCSECDVRNDCLRHALINHEHGVWGGTTDLQRAAMRAMP